MKCKLCKIITHPGPLCSECENEERAMSPKTTRILDAAYEALITDPAYLRELAAEAARTAPGSVCRTLYGLALYFEQAVEIPGEAVTVEDPGPVEALEKEVERLTGIIEAKDKAIDVLQREVLRPQKMP